MYKCHGEVSIARDDEIERNSSSYTLALAARTSLGALASTNNFLELFLKNQLSIDELPYLRQSPPSVVRHIPPVGGTLKAS